MLNYISMLVHLFLIKDVIMFFRLSIYCIRSGIYLYRSIYGISTYFCKSHSYSDSL